SRTSSALSPPRRSLATPSVRHASTSVSDSSGATSASASRYVAASSSRASPPLRSRCRSSSRVGRSAQWMSSSTSSTCERRDEAALARARLAGDQRDSATLTRRPRQQRAQDVELLGAANELEGRAVAQKSGEQGLGH